MVNRQRIRLMSCVSVRNLSQKISAIKIPAQGGGFSVESIGGVLAYI